MFIRQCKECGLNLGINFYIDENGKPNHLVCKNCRNKTKI